jgi:F-type H+-transporting ATPase subunit gamma
MPSLERMQQTIASTQDLQSVVKTMKALAAVNIRQFEKASAALKAYNRNVRMGLQAVLRNRPGFAVTARPAEQGPLGAVIFGTDQGMCGPINEAIVAHAMKTLDRETVSPQLAAVGARTANRLADEGRNVSGIYSVPGSPEAVTPLVQRLVLEIERWMEAARVGRVFLFYSTPKGGASYRPRRVRLLPVDRRWLGNIRAREWPGNQLPWFSMAWRPLFAALMREYLFVSLYRASVDALTSENASRLAAMQGAESNIEERLEELQGRYQQARQTGITEELQDIVSGFEALQKDGAQND